MKYMLEITKVYKKCVVTEADTLQDARNRIKDALYDGEIGLGCEDFIEQYIKPCGFDGGLIPDDFSKEILSCYEHYGCEE